MPFIITSPVRLPDAARAAVLSGAGRYCLAHGVVPAEAYAKAFNAGYDPPAVLQWFCIERAAARAAGLDDVKLMWRED